jgi:GTP-binding protein HflX
MTSARVASSSESDDPDAMMSTDAPPPRAILVGVQLPGVDDDAHAASLIELGRLAKTLGLKVVGQVSQKRGALAAAAVLGEGKLQDLARLTGGSGVVPSGVPAHRMRSGGQRVEEDPRTTTRLPRRPTSRRRPIRRARRWCSSITTSRRRRRATSSAPRAPRCSIAVRSFSPSSSGTRAAARRVSRWRSRASRTWRRACARAAAADRQSGGIGGKGAGESQIELDRRKVRDRIAQLRRDLTAIEKDAATRRRRRADQPTVAIVGYTNAGKSSLMRALTSTNLLVADQLFATLDTTVRALQPETVPRILVSDTVGFIKKLPHDLVASFRSTLDAAREASLLLHVVDAADPDFPAQIAVTTAVLADIDAADLPRLLLLNKADKLDAGRRTELEATHPEAVLLSSRSPDDVAALHARIVAFFERDMVEEELLVPYTQQRLIGEIHATCRVLGERYDEVGRHLRVRAHPSVVARLRAQR